MPTPTGPPAAPATQAHLKRLRALRSARGRHAQRACLLEGEKLVREALAAGAPIQEILVTEERAAAIAAYAGATPIRRISASEAERLADTRTPQGCFAVMADDLPSPTDVLAALPPPAPLTVLVLDGIQDPGNVGALVRVAAAFALDAVLYGPGTADPLQSKVLRAATGAWFQIRSVRVAEVGGALETLRGAGVGIYGAAREGTSIFTAPALPERLAVVFGNEGAGLSPDAAARLDGTLSVPIAAGVESLNVAVAAGILLAAIRRPVVEGGGGG